MNRPVPLHLTLADECFEVMPHADALHDYARLILIQAASVHLVLERDHLSHRTEDFVKALTERFFPEGTKI